MEYVIIPFISGYVGIYTYYVYSSIRFIRILRERHIFYVNTVITLTPALIYTYSLLNNLLYGIPYKEFMLKNFSIDWTITTPLILLNITDVVRLNLTNQLIVTACASMMNIFGFVANGVRDLTLMYVFYGAGCVCLLTIFSYIGWIYYQQTWIFIDNPRRTRVITALLYPLVFTWTLYPIVFILYKHEVVDFDHAMIGFLCLDFLSKGAFIFTLMRHQELLYIYDSFTNQLKIRSYKPNVVLPSVSEHLELAISSSPRTETPCVSST